MPDGSVELLMFAEGMVLADQADVLLTVAEKIGGGGPEAMIVLQFSGKVNNEDRRMTLNVAMPPKGAFDFAGSILDVIERAINEAEGA